MLINSTLIKWGSNMKNNKNLMFLIYTLIITFSMLCVSVIAFDNNIEEGYSLLWLLPFSFTLLSMCSLNILNQITKSIALAIIYGGYFIRFVLTPFFLKLGNYRVIFNTLNPMYIEKAILLMTYEITLVLICLELYLLKSKKRTDLNNHNMKSIFTVAENNKTLHFILIFTSFICLIILLYIPWLLDSFTSIFSNKLDIVTNDYSFNIVVYRGSLERILATLFVFIFDFLRYIIPVYLLELNFKKHKYSNLGYILAIFVCFSPFMVISGSNVQPFIGLIINIVMLIKLYPNKRKSILRVFSVLSISILLALFISKLTLIGEFSGTSNISSLGMTLNAYFPGVGNTAAAFNIIDNNKLQTLFYDMFSTLPFRYSFFPTISSKEVTLTMLFTQYNFAPGNIIPTVSGAAHYLGIVLAPIIPVLLTIFSVRMEKRAKQKEEYWHYFYYMFFSIRVAMIPNTYNHVSFISIMINQLLPIYLGTILINRLKFRTK